MSICLTADQIDAVSASHDADLLFHCDACPDGETFRQGENDGKLFRVTLSLIPNTALGDVEVDLCRMHLRLYRGFVSHGAMFCECHGIVERTGRTRPIKNGDGVWEEFKCENLVAGSGPGHYHEWDPLD